MQPASASSAPAPLIRRNSEPSPPAHFPSPYRGISLSPIAPLPGSRAAALGSKAAVRAALTSPGPIRSLTRPRSDSRDSQALGLQRLAGRFSEVADQIRGAAPAREAGSPDTQRKELHQLVTLIGAEGLEAPADSARGRALRRAVHAYYQRPEAELKARWEQLADPMQWCRPEGVTEAAALRLRRLEMEVAAELVFSRDKRACERDFEATRVQLQQLCAAQPGLLQPLPIQLLRLRLQALARMLPPTVLLEQFKVFEELPEREDEAAARARAITLLALRAAQMDEAAARRDLVEPHSLRRLQGKQLVPLAMQGRLIRQACEDATPFEREALRLHCVQTPLPADRRLNGVATAMQLRRMMVEAINAMSPPASLSSRLPLLCDFSDLAAKLPEGTARNEVLLRGLEIRSLLPRVEPRKGARGAARVEGKSAS